MYHRREGQVLMRTCVRACVHVPSIEANICTCVRTWMRKGKGKGKAGQKS